MARVNLLKLAVVFLLITSSLFFIGGPKVTALPTLRYLWSLGHIVFYFCAVFLFTRFYSIKKERQSIYIFLAVLIISLAIELIQTQTGRYFSIGDILRNLVGSAAALLLASFDRVTKIAAILLMPFLLLDGWRLWQTAHTDYATARLFPVIEDFESQATASRWDGNITQVTDHVFAGHYSAKLHLPVKKYSGVSLGNISRDWREFHTLEMHIFNPEQETQNLDFRINDEQHELAEIRTYNDRFNTQFTLKPGWNHILIPLAEIKKAPQDRDMDMSKITTLIWFMTDLKTPATVYFDEFRLQP